jgi:hypothetical protein
MTRVNRNLARVTPRDVMLQLVNCFSLSGNDPPYEIPDRYEAQQFSVLNYREMANAVLCHESHTIFDGMVPPDDDHGTRHEAEATIDTMAPDAYVNHVPVLTGGVGHNQLREFYSRHFIPKIPQIRKSYRSHVRSE